MIEWLLGSIVKNLVSIYVLGLIVSYLQRLSRMEANVNLSEEALEDRTVSEVTPKDTVDSATPDGRTATLDENVTTLDGDTSTSVKDTSTSVEDTPTSIEVTVISDRHSPTSDRDTELADEDTATSDKNSTTSEEGTVNSDTPLDKDTAVSNKNTAYFSTATLKELDINENGSILAAELARDLKRYPELLLISDMSKIYYEVNGAAFVENGGMGTNHNETIVPYELYKVAKEDENDSEDEDLTTELEVTTQNFPQGYVINSNVFLTDAQWHTMSLVDGNLFRCAVCQMYCDRANCVEHIDMASHLRNLDQYRPLKKFDLSIVRKIHENFHCGVCNDIFDIIDYTTHENSKIHEENLLTAINKVSDLMYDSNIHGRFFTDRKFHYTDRIISNTDRNTHSPVRNVQTPDRNIQTPDRDRVFRNNNNEFHFDANAFDNNEINVYEEYSDDGDEDTEEYIYEGEEYSTPFEGISYAKMASKPRIELPKFLKIDLGTKEVRVKFESWHMIIKTEANRFYCMVCNEHDLIRFKSKHCISCGHLERLSQCNVVRAFEDYLIRKVNDRLYHCGHCNNLQYQNQMNDHIESFHPKKNNNFIDNSKNIKKPKNEHNKIDKTYSEIQRDAIVTKNLQSRINNKVDIAFDIFDEVKLSPFGCELRIPALTFNLIMVKDGDYYCAVCDKTCPDVKGHVEESEHMELMTMTPFIRPFKNHLTRAVRGTLHCSLCNKLLQVGEIYNHNLEEPHIAALAIAMGMRKIQNTPTNYKNNFNNYDLNKTNGDQNTASGDLKTASGDLKTASGDLKTASTDAKTASVDMKTASVDLKAASTDAKTASVDMKTASVDLKTASTDLKTASTDLKAHEVPDPITVSIPKVSPKNNNEQLKNNAQANVLKISDSKTPPMASPSLSCPKMDTGAQMGTDQNVQKPGPNGPNFFGHPQGNFNFRPSVPISFTQPGQNYQNIGQNFLGRPLNPASMGQNYQNPQNFQYPVQNAAAPGQNYQNPAQNAGSAGQNYPHPAQNAGLAGQNYPHPAQNAGLAGQNYQNSAQYAGLAGQNYQNPAQNFQYPVQNAVSAGQNYLNPAQNPGLAGQNFQYPIQNAGQHHHNPNSVPRPNTQHGPNQNPAKNPNLPPMYNQFFPRLPPVNTQALKSQFVGAPLNYNFNGTRAPFPAMPYLQTQNNQQTNTTEQQKTVKSQDVKKINNTNSVKSDIKTGMDVIKTGMDIIKTGMDTTKSGTDIKSNDDTLESVNVSIDSENPETQTEEDECKEFDEEELVFLKLKTTYFKITNLSYNSLVYLDNDTRHCFVCSNSIRVPFLHKHVESRVHAENIGKNKFLDKYGVQLFRQMYLMYHCAICNVLMTRKEIKLHLDWPVHIENYDIAHRIFNKRNRKELKSGIKEYVVETQKEAIFNNVNEPKFNLVAAYQIVPNMEVKKDALETKPAKGSNPTAVKKYKMVILNNVVMKICFDHWHGITSSKNVTKCVICQVEIGHDEVFEHVVTEYHEVALGKPFEKSYYPALIRILNENSINCMVCNLELPNNEYMVFEHINGRKHNKNQEAIVNEGSNSDSYADCYEDYLNL